MVADLEEFTRCASEHNNVSRNVPLEEISNVVSLLFAATTTTLRAHTL